MKRRFTVSVDMMFDVEAESEDEAKRMVSEGLKDGRFCPSPDEITTVETGGDE